MAQEEIKLVGSFDDQITKKLKALNKEILKIGRSFKKFGHDLKPISKEFGKLTHSAKAFNTALKEQNRLLDTSSRKMRDFKTNSAKMSVAMRSLQAQQERVRRESGISKSQRRSQSRRGGGGGIPYAPMPAPVAAPKVRPAKAPRPARAPAPMPMPAAAPAAAPKAPKAPRGPRAPMPAMPSGGGKGFGASAASSFMGNVASTAIGMGIASAFMGGISKLGQMLQAPFQKFASAFAERVGDEMDDIKSAGGLFALDMDLTETSGNERFFKNYNEALRYQEKLNIDMAESAASLPGVTSQYVATSRQLTDTIQMVMEKDREGFNKMAETFGANVTGGGVDASKEALRTVLQKQTEQVVLQSQGQQGGLPMHIAIQQLLGKEAKGGKIGVQAFTNKFRAAFQKNPLLKNFLLRAEDEMAKTEAGSVDRLKIIMDTFDAAMPKEVINKMRGSISGMQEALRSGLLDPQAGLFGMSRAAFDPATGQKLMKKNVDDFGNTLYKFTADVFPDSSEMQAVLKAKGIEKGIEDTMKGLEFTGEELSKMGFKLNEAGKVIEMSTGDIVGDFSKSSTYIFEQIREIMAGFGPVLLEFVGFLPQLFDPFGQMTKNLMSFRDVAQQFISGFNTRLDIIEDAAIEFSNMEDGRMKGIGSQLKGQSRSRAAMDTVASYLKGIGAINEDLFSEIRSKTQDFSVEGIENFDLGDTVGKLIKATLESDLMKDFAKVGGLIVGGITKVVVDLIKMVTGGFKGQMGNKLAEGFAEGFQEAFGDMNMGEVSGILVEALNAILLKVSDIIVGVILPALGVAVIQGVIGMITSGNPIGMIIGALGIAKIAGLVGGLIGGIGAVISLVTGALGALAGAASFVAANFALISGIVGTVLTAIVAPVLAVAGAVMIVIAIVRNFGAIVQMVGGLLKVGFASVIQAMTGGISGLVAGIGQVLSALGGMVPVIGGQLKALGDGMQAGVKGFENFTSGIMESGMSDIKQASGDMAQQFRSDTAAIKGTFSGLTESMNPLTGAMSSLTSSTTGVVEAQERAIQGFDAATTKALMDSGVSAQQVDAMAANQPGIDAQIAALRAGPAAAPAADTRRRGQGARNRIVPGPAAAPAAPMPAIPAAPLPDLAPAIAQVEQVAGKVDAVGTAAEGISTNVEGLGTAAAAAEPPITALPPSVEAAKTGLDTIEGASQQVVSALQAVESGLNVAVATAQSAAEQVSVALVGAANNAGAAITTAAQGLAAALSSAASSIKGAASASASASSDKAGNAYGGHSGGPMSTMPLGQAIETEKKNMPSGADLVIANSSETIIPAFKGNVGDGFKGLSFAELESAAGFDRMATYTEQISDIADKTAASFSGGFGGALGGGSATLNAMEALGHSFGLITTSGHRPGDPGYHGVNRARDLSNGGGETPEMNAAAAKMANDFGSSLTELIYTPMGFSIKHGQKTGLISPSNHYHHIHVAVAEGLAKAAVFSSEKAALQYEKSMMPAGSDPMKVDLSSMTANSSEFSGGGNQSVSVGDVNVSVSGVNDAKAIANDVAEEILHAIEKATYTELFTS